jgi:thymidylate kinase
MIDDAAALQRSPPLTIELIGLPGAGKTTLLNALASKLNEQGYKFSTRYQIDIWSKNLTMMNKLALFVKNLRVITGGNFKLIRFIGSLDLFNKEIIMRAVKTPLINIYHSAFEKQSCSELILLDQGAIQHIWSIGAISQSYKHEYLQSYFENLILRNSVSCLYIYVSASPELASKRISDRLNGDSRFDEMEYEQRCMKLSSADFLMRALIEMLRQSKCQLLEIDAVMDIESKTKKIMEVIRSRSLNL